MSVHFRGFFRFYLFSLSFPLFYARESIQSSLDVNSRDVLSIQLIKRKDATLTLMFRRTSSIESKRLYKRENRSKRKCEWVGDENVLFLLHVCYVMCVSSITRTFTHVCIEKWMTVTYIRKAIKQPVFTVVVYSMWQTVHNISLPLKVQGIETQKLN
jgi:hypothetical protein